MKRTSIGMILMLLLVACGSTTGGSAFSDPHVSGSNNGGSNNGGSNNGGSNNGGSNNGGSNNGGSNNGGSNNGAYYTVSGRVVHRDTGEPYPKAYVRFAWLVNASYEAEAHTLTDGSGRYQVQLLAGQYQVTAGDSCDLNAGFAIAGRAPDDVMITVPGTNEVNFVEYPITPGADLPGLC